FVLHVRTAGDRELDAVEALAAELDIELHEEASVLTESVANLDASVESDLVGHVVAGELDPAAVLFDVISVERAVLRAGVDTRRERLVIEPNDLQLFDVCQRLLVVD